MGEGEDGNERRCGLRCCVGLYCLCVARLKGGIGATGDRCCCVGVQGSRAVAPCWHPTAVAGGYRTAYGEAPEVGMMVEVVVRRSKSLC